MRPGVAVEGIWQHEQTLEDFYLTLVTEPAAVAANGTDSMFFAQLRNELWKLFGKKRTYIGFGAFLLAQNGHAAGVQVHALAERF